MAQDVLDDATRADIAAQISSKLPGANLWAAGPAPQLAESLKVMLLTRSALDGAQGSLAERVTDTGQWHHQVYVNNEPTTFARSEPVQTAADGRHEVVQVARSALPAAVAASVEVADQQAPEDTTARLVVAPSFQVAALWVSGEGHEEVVVSVAPASAEGLRPGTRLDADTFVKRLASSRAVAGMGAPPDLDAIVRTTWRAEDEG